MTEQDHDTSGTGLTRRQVLTRAAAAGAVAWTAPVLISSTAHAAGTKIVVCPPDDKTRPNSMTWEYNKFLWDWDTCDAFGDPMDNGRSPLGGVSPQWETIVLSGSTSPFSGPVTFAPSNVISHGQSFTASFTQPTSGQPANNIKLTFYEQGNPAITRSVQVHISCSQGLCLNDVHGSFVLKGASIPV